ncbi:MAG TPA: hypothetical protein VG737_01340 [Cyclobacteriaceae bacterium]|nr:hypothetical protein [Cyclobacteriaceae bacterium]
MELDDLKEKWKTATVQSPVTIKDVLAKKISAIERSGKGMRRVFYLEMVFVALVYAGFLWLVWAMGDLLMTYMYKLVITTAIATVPVGWRMYKAQKWINSMDYTIDMRSNMVAFLDYYKTSLRWYQWSTYIIIIVILALFFTDNDFIGLQSRVKVTVVIYLVAVFFLTEPYIRIVYGKRIPVFENFLRE